MGLLLSTFFTTQESSINSLRHERPPLSGNDAIQALQRAEQIDQYKTLIHQSIVNTLARKDHSYMPTNHTNTLPIPSANPKEPWPNGQVIWMDSSADAGLPHTRAPYYICLPINIQFSNLSSTLYHERIHVSQRLHPNAWKELMNQAWSMTPWNDTLPADLEKRRRINPDLLGAPLYSWKNTWVPFGIFRSISQPSLKDIDIVWWNIPSRTLHRDPPPAWKEYFGNHPAGEHPYEIAAYILTEKSEALPAYRDLRVFIQQLPTTEV